MYEVMLVSGLLALAKFYTFLLTVRIYLTWFPVINMYEQPFFTLKIMTDWFLLAFRAVLPPMYGLDLSPVIAFYFLFAITRILQGWLNTIWF